MKRIVFFKDLGKKDIPLVGGKGANLGELYNLGIPVPNGFVVSADVYFELLRKTSLVEKIKTELKGITLEDTKGILRASERIKQALSEAKMPEETRAAIVEAYEQLSGKHDQKVAVRSSATAEDLPEASFAGQQRTFINVKGTEKVLEAVQGCWASLFEPRAIFYRADKGFDHMKVGLAVVVQLMVDSEVSGVAFSLDPLTNNPDNILIEAAYGFGEAVVSGALTPDQYLVDKRRLKLVNKIIAKQTWEIAETGKIPVSRDYQTTQKLPDKFIIELADYVKRIEAHYQIPQDTEWALANKKMYIVQTRPVTTMKEVGKLHRHVKAKDVPVLLSGAAASPGVASGPVKIIKSAKNVSQVIAGDVLVTEMTDPDFVPAMRKAVAIVTDSGGRTSHAAIVSRELGIPCIVGTDTATQILKNGEIITVDGSSGNVYSGQVALEEEKQEITVAAKDLKTATKIYVNLGEPELAQEMAGRNVDGVGLLRAEFMIAKIGTHPKKMIEENKEKGFVTKLAEGMETFAAAFDPRPVVYRATDFKTNEYRNLKGGEQYEGQEENPLMGFRGAARYVANQDVFQLELKALKLVRNKKGFKNLHLMIPFVRSVQELMEVKKMVSAAGLRRSANFNLWMMVEIPSNVILLEKFLEVGVDGVSVGTNDLTMLILGVDRDNPKIANAYNEMDEAVLWSLEKIIKTCHKAGVTSSICGQAPSDHPLLVRKLVQWGMTSISVNPDVIEKTRQIVADAEHDLVATKK